MTRGRGAAAELNPEYDDLVAGYEIGAALDEQNEEIHGPPLQAYGAAGATELVIANVEREVEKSNDAA